MPLTEQERAKMQKLFSKGATYKAIATGLGVGYGPTRRALDPEAAERDRLDCREYRRTHKKQMAEYHVAYSRTNKKRIATRQAAHRKTHKKALAISAREYYIGHRGDRLAYQLNYTATHKQEISEYGKAHRPELAAKRATRRALILGATIGNLAQIKEIYERAKDGSKIRCYLCGKLIPKGERAVDHIIPLSKGGKHTASNLAIACFTCNAQKHDKLPEELGLLL